MGSVIVYYHYSNGIRYAGTHHKILPSRERARAWIKWMEANMTGFVFDEMQ